MDIKKNGIIGIKYLIKYIDTLDKKYLDIVKRYTSEIRFWVLLTLYTSNSEEIFKDIPEYLLEKLFNLLPVERKNNQFNPNQSKCYDYGDGISTSHNLSYIDQFRLIRNCLAHNSFEIKWNLITVCDKRSEYHATFDIKWFESLTLCCLSNNQYTIKKGMNDISLVCCEQDDLENLDDFLESIKAKNILFLRTVLNTDSIESINNKFDKRGKVEDEKKSFDMLKQLLVLYLTKEVYDVTEDSDINKLETTKKVIEKLNAVYGKVMELSLVPINPDNISIIRKPGFEKLSLMDRLQSIIDFIAKKDKVKDNSISTKRTLNILYCLENDLEITNFINFNFCYSRDFLLKTYSNIMFICFLEYEDNFPLKEEVMDFFADNMSFSYIHAKNVYADILKVINRCLKGLKENNGSIIEQTKYANLAKSYSVRYDEALENKPEKVLFRKIRNSIVHDNIEFTPTEVKIIDKEHEISLPFFSKKTGIKENRIIEPKGSVYECTMLKKDFECMLDYLCDLLGIKTTIDNNLTRSKINLPVDNT